MTLSSTAPFSIEVLVYPLTWVDIRSLAGSGDLAHQSHVFDRGTGFACTPPQRSIDYRGTRMAHEQFQSTSAVGVQTQRHNGAGTNSSHGHDNVRRDAEEQV